MVGFPFVAAVQTSASGEPGHRAFYGPTVAAEPLRGFDAFAGDTVPDASAGQPSPQVVVVVALVGVKFVGPASPRSSAGADRRYALH